MGNDKSVRIPQQKRSIEKKEKITSAAYKLFCEKGYYNTSTPEIASEAGVSVGCLYSYFKDKRTIFIELIQNFYGDNFEILSKNLPKSNLNLEDGIREIINIVIKNHEKYKGFFRELTVLCYYDTEIAKLSDKLDEKLNMISLEYVKHYKDLIKVKDYEAAVIVVTGIIDSITHRISFHETSVDKERILNEGINAILKYLFAENLND
ncbi:TetR/AcrR family transcriptional regulator [Clostridium neuense]|uniref:TetR/AcrR family transcriptional regulator n=1 Tax=Clostridium neuense TaxID=1728934 RepID=A0ABW8TG86_9CLOT